MSEKQSEHRQKLENMDSKFYAIFMILGLTFAFIVAIVGYIGGIFLIYNNKSVEGLAVLIAETTILISAFLFKKKEKR